MDQRLQFVFEEKANSEVILGLSASLRKGYEEIWRGYYGYSHDDVKIDSAILFGIGSITKNITAAIILQLADEGKLLLSDKISDYLPDYYNVNSSITIEQLLNHTSGIYNLTDNALFWIAVQGQPNKIWEPGEQLGYVQYPVFEPGSDYAYSNTNYILLGMIIEEVTDNSFAEELHNRITEPIQLKQMFLYPNDILIGSLSHVWNLSLNMNLDITSANNTKAMFSIAYSAGAIVSTAGDLSKYFYALNSGSILSLQSLMAMQTGSSQKFRLWLGHFYKRTDPNGEK
ncbi:MAG: beta-lactamase family protein [Bacteroidales bacterium]|nr:beta-lactamase family protein [Bacteroidales bacterium]